MAAAKKPKKSDEQSALPTPVREYTPGPRPCCASVRDRVFDWSRISESQLVELGLCASCRAELAQLCWRPS